MIWGLIALIAAGSIVAGHSKWKHRGEWSPTFDERPMVRVPGAVPSFDVVFVTVLKVIAALIVIVVIVAVALLLIDQHVHSLT